MEPTPTLRELIDGYTWCSITVDAPDWYICPVYKIILGQEETFEKICSDTPLTFAPGLLQVLKSSSPPSLDFFRSLPPPPVHEKVWAVYALILEKPGCKAKVYTGSRTDSNAGVVSRLKVYDGQSRLPRYVKRALDDGYTITSRGLLCWVPLSAITRLFTIRVYIFALEAVFCFIFFSGFETKLDALWTVFLPWRREDVDWLPLCSHTALMECPPGQPDHFLTDGELETYNEERQQRAKERMAVISKRYEDNERANDLEGYLARKRREKLAWAHANKDKVLSIAAGVRTRAKASNKHRCETCHTSLASNHALKKHLNSKAHKEQLRLAGGESSTPASTATLRSRRFAAKNKANKTHYCAICDKSFNIKGHLAKHLLSKKHLKKAAAQNA